jgi:hypothetical protein
LKVEWRSQQFALSPLGLSHQSAIITNTLGFMTNLSLYNVVYFFSSVACVWVPGAKTTGPIVRNFKVRHMFCRNKKFCSVKSRLP